MSFITLFTAGLAAFAPLASAYTTPTGDPTGNAIYEPGLNSIVPVGKAFTITWEPTTNGTVSLVLLHGPSTNVVPIHTIVEGIDNSGSYDWTPSTDLAPNKTYYGLELIVDATGQYQYSTQFGISNPDYKSSSSSSASASASVSASTTVSVNIKTPVASSAGTAVSGVTGVASGTAASGTAASGTGVSSKSSKTSSAYGTGSTAVSTGTGSSSSSNLSSTLSTKTATKSSSSSSSSKTGSASSSGSASAQTGAATHLGASFGTLALVAGVAVFAV